MGPAVDVGRGISDDLAAASRREWLVTNGLGGFAAGTIAGLLTRRYHGLLIAALTPPLGRTLLVSKLDETAHYDGRAYPLFANRWRGGWIDPAGYVLIDRFHLEGTTPVWTLAVADALIEKRIWMQPEANTTYVRYDLIRASRPLALSLKALVNYRDYHACTDAGTWQMQVTPVEHGLRVVAYEGATPFWLLSRAATTQLAHDWYRAFELAVEIERGLDAHEDHLCAGVLSATLQPGQTVTIVASTELTPSLDGGQALQARQAHEQHILQRWWIGHAPRAGQAAEAAAEAAIGQLVLAADQFIVRRVVPDEESGRTVIAGYPWFGDWGRDTMISLPGLTLATGRPALAEQILRTFARVVDRGMVPNRFPDGGAVPEYNTVDATLWFVEAIRAYHEATGDDRLLADLWPTLAAIIEAHQVGTRYQIHVDPQDGLLYAGEPGVQLTWMDARVDGREITPRIGKAVEVNALWYNALCAVAAFAERLGRPSTAYRVAAEQAATGFQRFWHAAVGGCYDVIDGPDGVDASLRPNQLLAISLAVSPLSPTQQRSVVDLCARQLVTAHGLRSLGPSEPAYVGRYVGPPSRRDGVYHQGTVWAWLIGPFVSAHWRVYGDAEAARHWLRPLLRQIGDGGLGSLSEIADGDAPYTPRGCPAQAWSVGEVLRVWRVTQTETRQGDGGLDG